jgi:hypothetical protein
MVNEMGCARDRGQPPSGTACGAGMNTVIRSIVDLYHRVSRTDHDSQRGNDVHHHS